MKNTKIQNLFLLFFLLNNPAFSFENKTPNHYLNNFIPDEKVFWVGKVIDINVIKTDKEITIEWLCEYLELAKPIDINLYIKLKNINDKPPTILIKKTDKQYFVSTFRSPDMPIEVALESTKGMVEAGTYIIRDSQTAFIGKFKDKPAIYIGGGKGTVSSNIKVKYVE